MTFLWYNMQKVAKKMQWNVNYYLGNIIRKYREGRNWTQEIFAAKCNISRAYFGRIERGEHSATIDQCKKIADALEIPLYMLFLDIPD